MQQSEKVPDLTLEELQELFKPEDIEVPYVEPNEKRLEGCEYGDEPTDPCES